MIVCPLVSAPATTASSCCGPPVASPVRGQAALCCPPTAMCAEPFTFAVTPAPSVAGTQVSAEGDVFGAGAGVTVTLWRRDAGRSGGFAAAGTTTTGADGAYRLTVHPQTDDALYAASATRRSATITLAVRARVTSSLVISSDRRERLSSAVAPGHPGAVVRVQRMVPGGRWTTVRRLRLDRRSRARLTLAAATFRRWGPVRVELPGDDRNVTSDSRALSLSG